MADPRPTDPKQVQRTLVKSPPELWAELSNPESLARRLGEFGEIRITRLVPEKTVVWEGERASGTVEIESSGWGTKVRLSATPYAVDAQLERDGRPEAQALRDAVAEIEPGRGAAAEIEPEREAALKAELARAAALAAELEREAAIEAALREEIEREAAIEAALRAEIEAEAALEAETALEADRRRRTAAVEAEHDREVALAARPALPAAASATDVDAPAEARGFLARFRKRRRHAPAAAPQPAAVRAPTATPGPRHDAGSDPRTAGSVDPARPALKTPAVARPASTPAHHGPTIPARPDPAAQRPPVRLSALAFARANPGAGALPASTTAPAAEAPPLRTTAADFDGPGAETITAARRPRSARTPSKPVLDDEQTLAVLSSVLDDLGSAHHRPFSRE